MRWWGWGEDERAISLPPTAGDALRIDLGMDGSERGVRVSLEEVELPDSGLTAAAVSYTHLTLPTTPYV